MSGVESLAKLPPVKQQSPAAKSRLEQLDVRAAQARKLVTAAVLVGAAYWTAREEITYRAAPPVAEQSEYTNSGVAWFIPEVPVDTGRAELLLEGILLAGVGAIVGRGIVSHVQQYKKEQVRAADAVNEYTP